MSIVLIIPTYNEVDNIVPLIKQFFLVSPGLNVLVADSASPDGTAQSVKDNFQDQSGVRLLACSPKSGRGAAIIEAYHWIIQHQPATVIAIADADFSHAPDDFPRLLAALDSADLVIGSRYAPGGTTVNWPLSRRIFSAAANWLAARLLGVPITDYTNGYRVFHRRLLESLDLDQIDADGFIALSQELIQWHHQGAVIKEVPITFVNRVRGKSNFNLKLVIESLQVLIKLRFSSK